MTKDNIQTDAMVEFGSAAGHEIKIWRKGMHTPKVIGENSVLIEIPESILNKLGSSDLFPEKAVEGLVSELNNIKTSYA